MRTRYSIDVPIIIFADSGFADQKAYAIFEDDLKIHYVTTSKIYPDVKDYAQELPLKLFILSSLFWKFIKFPQFSDCDFCRIIKYSE